MASWGGLLFEDISPLSINEPIVGARPHGRSVPGRVSWGFQMSHFRLGGAVLAAALLASSALVSPATATDPGAPPLHYGAWGVDLTARNEAVRPGDDFFAYANGAYLSKTEIPSDQSWYGTINILRNLSEVRVRGLLEKAAATAPGGPAPGDLQGKIGAFYKAFMDEPGVEAKGAAPLAGDLAAIRAIKDKRELAA